MKVTSDTTRKHSMMVFSRIELEFQKYSPKNPYHGSISLRFSMAAKCSMEMDVRGIWDGLRSIFGHPVCFPPRFQPFPSIAKTAHAPVTKPVSTIRDLLTGIVSAFCKEEIVGFRSPYCGLCQS